MCVCACVGWLRATYWDVPHSLCASFLALSKSTLLSMLIQPAFGFSLSLSHPPLTSTLVMRGQDYPGQIAELPPSPVPKKNSVDFNLKNITLLFLLFTVFPIDSVLLQCILLMNTCKFSHNWLEVDQVAFVWLLTNQTNWGESTFSLYNYYNIPLFIYVLCCWLKHTHKTTSLLLLIVAGIQMLWICEIGPIVWFLLICCTTRAYALCLCKR